MEKLNPTSLAKAISFCITELKTQENKTAWLRVTSQGEIYFVGLEEKNVVLCPGSHDGAIYLPIKSDVRFPAEYPFTLFHVRFFSKHGLHDII